MHMPVLLTLSLLSFYMEPDPAITAVVDAPLPPWISVSPDTSVWLVQSVLRNPPISLLAQGELRLAGVRFNPVTGASGRTTTFTEMALMTYPEGEMISISGMPLLPMVKSFAWNNDGSMAVFTHETPEGVELWLLSTRNAEARRLTGPVVSLVAQVEPQWVYGRDEVLCAVIPRERGFEPEADPVPRGPLIQESIGVPSPARTMQDLLASPHDEALFRHHMTTRLARIGMDGEVVALGEPCMLWDFQPSPDGGYVLVKTLEEPFSYGLSAWRFPGRTMVWDINGETVFEVESHGLQDRIPIARGSVQDGRRWVIWREDADAELCWVEALDEGDAGVEASLRDRVFTFEAPFRGEPRVLATIENRVSDILWSSDTLAIVYDWWWPSRNTRAFRLRPGEPEHEPELILDYSFEDAYRHPGSLMTTLDYRGRPVLYLTGGSLYLKGSGATPEGERPFVDRLDLQTGGVERLFQSSPPFHENPLQFLDRDGRLLLFRRESANLNPNRFSRDLVTGEETRLTDFPHPYPWFQDMHKEVITYTREDGILLSATLYLPPGYSPGEHGPLPMLMWAYPRDFVSADAAGQVSGSAHSFDYIGWWSPMIWLLKGYAVLDDPAMPIVSIDGEPPNESFVEQLVMNAEAAVNAVVEMGVADRNRIAVGGHSYGAFMTASLLAHSDLFAAGLARTGAYNRTLTPFGFQSEDRSLWEAPDTYIRMSPFIHADGIDEPLLIIHGAADQNSGTFPMQSERLFAALSGLGGTARLVMLPVEDHSYRARESILHVLWESQEWLRRHVKGE